MDKMQCLSTMHEDKLSPFLLILDYLTFLSPSPPGLSTSGMQLSPFYTALSLLLITYPQSMQ
jgi:hypothetical protein